MSREDAYRLVQRHAMDAWTNDKRFRELVEADPEITNLLSKEKLDEVFHYQRQLRNVDAIFERVLAEDADLDAR
jgi:adenylosuccinate lyase